VSFVAGSIGNGDLSIQVCLRDHDALMSFLEDRGEDARRYPRADRPCSVETQGRP
jgi:hypothetical protein